jgi:endonuclease G
MADPFADYPDFEHFSDLKAASEALWQRRSSILADGNHDEGDASGFKEKIVALIKAGERSGTFLSEEGERRSAQDLLEMWSVELVTLGELGGRDFGLPQLVPFAGDEQKSENPEKLALSRDLIRLSATARQWLGSDKAKGYLLSGDALEQARALVDKDRDIAELVRASDEEERRKTRARHRTYIGIITVMALLMALLAAATMFALSEKSRAEAEREQVRKDADYAAKLSSQRIKDLRGNVNNAVNIGNTRFAELTDLQARYDRIVEGIKEAANNGSLNRGTAPRVLTDRLPQGERGPTFPAAGLLNGYDAGFLDTRVDVPKLGPDLQRSAYKAGEAVPYANYSLLLDRTRRLPIISMSNVDRTRLGVFPRQHLAFIQDPRLPYDVQPDLEWFRIKEIDRGQLVTRREIAWGAPDDMNPDAQAKLYEGIVSVYSNTAPQVANLNRTAWRLLENYAIDAFNPGAPRVSMFTGPAFRGTPPPELATAPTHFWKIMVSARANRRASELVVEAYLLPQVEPGGFPDDLGEILQRYRVRVTDIEALTGLDFGPEIRRADAGNDFVQHQVVTTGDRFRERAEVFTLVARARNTAALSLTAEERSSILIGLAAVPATSWALPDWRSLRGEVRRIIVDWTGASGDTGPPLDQAGLDAITRLKPPLGFELSSGETVYFQFAGFTRDFAVDTSRKLQSLGWNIPGEERTVNAANRSEVRYVEGNDGERAKAELLAGDLEALDIPEVRAVPNSLVKPGMLEIWISN